MSDALEIFYVRLLVVYLILFMRLPGSGLARMQFRTKWKFKMVFTMTSFFKNTNNSFFNCGVKTWLTWLSPGVNGTWHFLYTRPNGVFFPRLVFFTLVFPTKIPVVLNDESILCHFFICKTIALCVWNPSLHMLQAKSCLPVHFMRCFINILSFVKFFRHLWQ